MKFIAIQTTSVQTPLYTLSNLFMRFVFLYEISPANPTIANTVQTAENINQPINDITAINPLIAIRITTISSAPPAPQFTSLFPPEVLPLNRSVKY